MNLKENILEIKKFLLNRYKDNLAALLIFGSVNTGQFHNGKSDIDHMILLKKLKGLNAEKELKFLYSKLKGIGFSSQYFNDLQGIKNYIRSRKSFATYLVIATKDGSRVIYTTPEFERLRTYLKKHPLTRKEIQEQIKKKDKVELDGYFANLKGYHLSKQLMCHLRRKLQVMNYFKNKKIVFDYYACLDKVKLEKKEKEKLKKLYSAYKKRENLSKKDVDYYTSLARKFTQTIIEN